MGYESKNGLWLREWVMSHRKGYGSRRVGCVLWGLGTSEGCGLRKRGAGRELVR